MIKKDNQITQRISFPDWYNDPRDFHEAVLKTYSESKKLAAKKTRKPAIKLLYLPVKKGMIGLRYTNVCLGYILGSDYKKILIVYGDSEKSDVWGHQTVTIQHEFAELSIRPLIKQIPRSEAIDLVQVNKTYGYILSSLACLSKLESIDIVALGLQSIEHFEGAIELDQDTAVIVLAEFEKEVQHPIMGIYFEHIAQSQERKSKAINFVTELGDMTIQVA